MKGLHSVLVSLDLTSGFLLVLAEILISFAHNTPPVWAQSSFTLPAPPQEISVTSQQTPQASVSQSAGLANPEPQFLLPNPADLLPEYPTFNSQRLDQQLKLYADYLATSGPPDVLIVGSSRSLQGVDPAVLQQALAQRRRPGLRIYNFGINGATAQVVDLVLRQILLPEQLPKMILWADGSRAFNSDRIDVTYNGIAASEGYKWLSAGIRPILSLALRQAQPTARECPELCNEISSQQVGGGLNANGFEPVAARFSPAGYYRQFPRVSGRYDTNYVPFRLEGEQTAAAIAIATFARTRHIPLVFVNLPLTQEYLDSVRRT